MEMQVISTASIPWLSILVGIPAIVGVLVAAIAPLRDGSLDRPRGVAV